MARYRLQEMLGYLNSEVHQSYMPLFNPACSEEVRSARMAYLHKHYGLIEAALGRTPFLLGEHFTVADAYLFVVTRWAEFVKLDLSAFPKLLAFQARIAARPAVQKAMHREQLASA
jgi:glutathione S-transferase